MPKSKKISTKTKCILHPITIKRGFWVVFFFLGGGRSGGEEKKSVVGQEGILNFPDVHIASKKNLFSTLQKETEKQAYFFFSSGLRFTRH